MTGSAIKWETFSICFLFAFACNLNAYSLLYSFDFNESSTTNVSNSGDGSSSTISMLNSSWTATDLHGSSGSGVSGQSGDYAFDNSSATGMGNVGTGGMVRVTSATDVTSALSGLVSFTITGWYKAESAIGNGARLVDYTGTSAGFNLFSSTTGELTLSVNGSSVTSSSSGAYGVVGSWVFFAVSYDSVNGKANFYSGSTSASASLLVTQNFSKGVVIDSAANLFVGNWPGTSSRGARPFDGLLDEISIYGSTVTGDTGGALSLAQIQSIQASAIPEPGSVAFLLSALGMLMLFVKRKKNLLLGT